MSENGYISQEIIDEISARTDIVDLINRYVPLKAKGANYMGLCPFHSEKTPSFSVSPSKQIFHCFGCGKGGNAFKFLMEIEQFSFPEAVRFLAKETGVTIPETHRSPEERAKQLQRDRYYTVNQMAVDFYAQNLLGKKSPECLSYLKNREVSLETIKTFQLGVCVPEQWDALRKHMLSLGVKNEELMALGLVRARQDKSGFYDQFRNRLMFPIFDEKNRAIGFGGRSLEKDVKNQKYINSNETVLFHKSNMLFGLNLARKHIKAQNQVILVEGYLDMIQLYQHGIKNVVAPLGTALTKEQVKHLMRYTYNFVLAFDGDEAGRRAAKRGFEIISELGGRSRILTFPNQMDPDDFIKAKGQEGFEGLLLQAKDGISFVLDEAMREYGTERIEDTLKTLHEVLPFLLQIQSRVEFENTLDLVGESLHLSRQAILDELRVLKKKDFKRQLRYPSHEEEDEPEVKKVFCETIEEKDQGALLAALIQHPNLFLDIERLGGKNLFDEALQGLYLVVKARFSEHRKITGNDIPTEYTELYSYISTELTPQGVEEEQYDILLKKVVERSYERELKRIHQQMEKAEKEQDIDRLTVLMQEYQYYLKLKNNK